MASAWIVSARPDIHQQLQALLKYLGWEPRLYQTLRGALRALQTRPAPQVVLLDQASLEVLVRVRQQAHHVHLPVVVVGEKLSAEACDEVLHLGGDGCASLPLQSAELDRVLRVAVRRRRAMAG